MCIRAESYNGSGRDLVEVEGPHFLVFFLQRRVRQEHRRVTGKIILLYINELNVQIYDDSGFMRCSSYNF